jgi:NAD(P)-dependent dehydrogenase (short-subunit alcohol dehydrogenase family)
MTDQVVLITGTGRGIARDAALTLGADGWRVAALDSNTDGASATAEEINSHGGQSIALGADIMDENQVQAAVDKTVEAWGRVDVLINAASGYGQAFRATHETPLDEWNRVLGSNLTGYFLCAKHVLPQMMSQGSGRIINFASNAGRSVSPLLGASYTTAKTGVIGLTRHLAHEYGKHGIRVNTLAPGPVDSERVSELVESEDTKDALASQIPLGRLAQTDDVVKVLQFMVSDASSYMSGAILDVNGGYVLA